ncbi:MAG TPA: glycoside hydrolase family 15 protein, partial [Allosphingosinicella sp.]
TSVHTYSAVMSWAACDRLGNIAEALGLGDRASLWRERAATVRRSIEERAWIESEQRFGASFGGAELDASLLQLIDMRFLEPDDPRFLATFNAVERVLRRGEHMLRYAAEDDFGLPETAFNFCTFWLIEALHIVGRRDEARELYEKMLTRLTPAGLLSEDSDFQTGELWGNYPQTYSLVGLINCAMMLSKPWSSIR